MRSFAPALGLAFVLVACGDPAGPPALSPAVVVLPGPVGGPPPRAVSADPENLPGVETGELSSRERVTWWNAVSQFYAPCADQAVSIAQCVKESRSCGACRPAATLLAQKVRAGATGDQVRAVYAARFGPNVKKVDVADSPSRGPVDAPVQILVWSDFQCPHCRMAMPILEGLFQKYSPRIRLVHKFYPLQMHSTAAPAARAAIAAQNQGKYWDMERLLFAHQSDQSDADLARYAGLLQLDPARFKADLDADRTSKILERDHGDADKAGLTGTPFILINGHEFDLSYFRLEGDLEEWVSLEVELTGGAAAPPGKTASP